MLPQAPAWNDDALRRVTRSRMKGLVDRTQGSRNFLVFSKTLGRSVWIQQVRSWWQQVAAERWGTMILSTDMAEKFGKEWWMKKNRRH